MKTLLKLLAVCAAVFLLLLVGAAVALKVMFPPERIKAIALEKMESVLFRRVRIGEAAIGLRGIRLEDLEISEMPDFEAGTMVKVDRLRLSVRLKPLIARRELRVDELALHGWELHVVRDRKGELNVSRKPPEKTEPERDEREEKPGKPSGEEGGPPPFLLAVSEVNVSKGRILFEDKRERMKADVSDISLSADDVSLEEPFPAELGFDYSVTQGKEKYAGRFDFKGSIHPASGKTKEMGLDIKSCSLALGEMGLRAEGSVRDLDEPEVDLQLHLPELTPERLKPYAELPPAASLPPMDGRVQLKRTGKDLDVKEATLKGKGVSIDASLLQRGDLWRLRNVGVRYGRLSAKVGGKVRMPSGGRREPSFDLKVKADVDIAEAASYVPDAAEYEAHGSAKLDVRVRGTPAAPELSGDAVLDKTGFQASGQSFSGLKGKLAFTPGTMEGTLQGKLNDGELDIRLNARDYLGKSPSADLSGSLSMLDLADLPESEDAGKGGEKGAKKKSEEPQKKTKATTPVKTKGKFTIGSIRHSNFQASASRLDWDLRGVSTDLSKLNGSASFRIGEGKFQELVSLAKDKPFVKVALMPVIVLQRVAGRIKIPFFPKFDRVRFNEIVGDYAFTDGVMRIRTCHLDSALAYAEMTGTADLGKDKLDLHISNRLPGKTVAGPIGFKVKGSLSDPKVRLDPVSILKQPAVQKPINKGKEILQKKGQELLKNLFRR